jgi:hypothetical protein
MDDELALASSKCRRTKRGLAMVAHHTLHTDLKRDFCHTRFSEENQVLNYMYARIKFHTYSDIIVYNRNNIT